MDSSRRHVRGDEHLELAPLEAPERCLAFWLAQLGRERAGTHSVPAEELSDEADSFDLVGEDEDAPLVMLVAVIVAATLASACAELAMTVVALIPVALVFAFLQRFITTGIASTGMK